MREKRRRQRSAGYGAFLPARGYLGELRCFPSHALMASRARAQSLPALEFLADTDVCVAASGVAVALVFLDLFGLREFERRASSRTLIEK